MTFRTIQPIGKKPDTIPSSEARIDMPAGIVKMKMVIRLATITAMMAAICALTLPLAISTRRVMTGMAAATVDNTNLSSGLYTWIPIVSPPRFYSVADQREWPGRPWSCNSNIRGDGRGQGDGKCSNRTAGAMVEGAWPYAIEARIWQRQIPLKTSRNKKAPPPLAVMPMLESRGSLRQAGAWGVTYDFSLELDIRSVPEAFRPPFLETTLCEQLPFDARQRMADRRPLFPLRRQMGRPGTSGRRDRHRAGERLPHGAVQPLEQRVLQRAAGEESGRLHLPDRLFLRSRHLLGRAQGLSDLPQSMAADPLAALDDRPLSRRMAARRQPLPDAAGRRRGRQPGPAYRRRHPAFRRPDPGTRHRIAEFGGDAGVVRRDPLGPVE